MTDLRPLTLADLLEMIPADFDMDTQLDIEGNGCINVQTIGGASMKLALFTQDGTRICYIQDEPVVR